MARLLAVLVSALVVLPGCGSSEAVGKLSGRVTFQGVPVSEGLIVFSNPAQGAHMKVELRPGGDYVVKRFGTEGVPLGKYQVWITPPLLDAPMGPAREPPRIREYQNIPKKYRDANTSGLTLTVEEGENLFYVNMKAQGETQ
jgi:hypothetical protein